MKIKFWKHSSWNINLKQTRGLLWRFLFLFYFPIATLKPGNLTHTFSHLTPCPNVVHFTNLVNLSHHYRNQSTSLCYVRYPLQLRVNSFLHLLQKHKLKYLGCKSITLQKQEHNLILKRDIVTCKYVILAITLYISPIELKTNKIRAKSNKKLPNRTMFSNTVEQILLFELEFGNNRTKHELSSEHI